MKKLYIFFIFVLCALCSCSENELINQSGKTRVTCSVDKFEQENVTRTTVDLAQGTITWASGDVIGIFPREGYQEPFIIPTDQVGHEDAVFDGGYWALKSGCTYNAYYPFDKANFESADSKTTIPVYYDNQRQVGNQCNAGAFDYTYSDWATAGSGSLNFNFHHIGSFYIVSLKIPATSAYESLTIKASNPILPKEGYYDLTAQTPAFVATETSSSITMHLVDFNAVAGETVKFYFMMPPVDMRVDNTVITAELSTGETSCEYSLLSRNIKAGYKYELNGEPKQSGVSGTIDGWLTDEEEEPTPTDTTPYLTFKSSGVQTLQIERPVETLEYSVNGGEWHSLGTTKVTFGGSNGDIRLRGQSSTGTAIYEEPNWQGNAIMFSLDAGAPDVYCSGDIRTLIDYTNYSTTSTANARFISLFWGNSVLKTAPLLPSTELASKCYSWMFASSGIIDAPALPAMTLSADCYSSMFEDCKSLKTAPALNATTMKESCYQNMFTDCTSLEQAPVLPATTLANYCYAGMFAGCTSFTTTPELPVEKLAEGCYQHMFSTCSNLVKAPVLPATTLAPRCYYAMFNYCTSLETAPELPALTLTQSCYQYMFADCENLNNVKMLATDISANNSTYKMLGSYFHNLGVSPTGTFYKSIDATWNDGDVVPEGWTVKRVGPDYVTFHADDVQTFFLDVEVPTIEYSVDNGTWKSLGTNTVTFGGSRGDLRLRGKSSYGTATTWDGEINNWSSAGFGNSDVPVYASGDIRTLVDYENYETADCSNARFMRLFIYQDALITAPKLPSTNLASHCYESMFYECANLATAPELPARTLSARCYYDMFNGCESLEKAPVLLASTLAPYCYYGMLNDCPSLNYVKMLATDFSAEGCLDYWLGNVPSSGSFVKHPNANLPSGIHGIPEGWTISTATY